MSSMQHPSGLLATSGRDILKLQQILKGFIKKISEKCWKFLIENRFWNFGSKIFRRNLENLEKSKIKKVGFQLKFSSIFRDFSRFFNIFEIENFRIFEFFIGKLSFSSKIEKSKISSFENFQKFSDQNFKIDFRSKNVDLFSWTFFKSALEIPGEFKNED